jgi:hypothetical protein
MRWFKKSRSDPRDSLAKATVALVVMAALENLLRQIDEELARRHGPGADHYHGA